MDSPTSIFKLTLYQPPSGAREDKVYCRTWQVRARGRSGEIDALEAAALGAFSGREVHAQVKDAWRLVEPVL